MLHIYIYDISTLRVNPVNEQEFQSVATRKLQPTLFSVLKGKEWRLGGQKSVLLMNEHWDPYKIRYKNYKLQVVRSREDNLYTERIALQVKF